MDSPAANTRARLRSSQMASPFPPNGSPTTTKPPATSPPTRTRTRNPPYLPTPLETALLALYPALLLFGTLFSALSPQTRSAPFDAHAHAHAQDPALALSYFARKDNLFNTLFVKRGWAWVTAATAVLVLTHPALRAGRARVQAGLRWGVATGWWVLVTQWCFGPALIDRGFRYTGGKCEMVEMEGGHGKFSAMACKAAGGRWSGGHDISGHVFLLVLGSGLLAQEAGWVYRRWRGGREERSVVMPDGVVKGADVEAERAAGGGSGSGTAGDVLGVGGKVVAGVVVLKGWMLLMTAIYFHTWFEKLTGLLVALTGLYTIYILPRWIPALRAVIGLPGI